MVTMVVLSLLDVLHLVINTSLGEVAVLSLKRATNYTFLFVVTPPMRWEWFTHGGSSFDRRSRMDVANPTFEEMA
jgi:hypothetical protein